MNKIVSNININDLAKSIIVSGYAMRTDIKTVKKDIKKMKKYLNNKTEYNEEMEKHIKRFIGLGTCDGTSGHTQCLTGVNISFDLKFSIKGWIDIERYKFLNFITSQSTMHRLAKFDLIECTNEYVDEIMLKRLIEIQSEYIDNPTPENYLKLLYNNICGFTYTAGMTTSYRCLITIYHQRKNHKLPEFRKFCKWIETLPLMKYLLGLEEFKSFK